MSSDEPVEEIVVEEQPKRRGRPRKNKVIEEELQPIPEEEPEPETKPRGRPKKETTKPQRPKRKCTEKQLEALARGRAMNKRFHPKTDN